MGFADRISLAFWDRISLAFADIHGGFGEYNLPPAHPLDLKYKELGKHFVVDVATFSNLLSIKNTTPKTVRFMKSTHRPVLVSINKNLDGFWALKFQHSECVCFHITFQDVMANAYELESVKCSDMNDG